MGLFDKIVKSVTGSWADIVVDTQSMTPGLTRDFTARIAVKEKPIEFTRIIAEVRCIESATVSTRSDGDSFGSTRQTETAYVHDATIELLSSGSFNADHSEEISFPVSIPAEGPFSFNGQHVSLEWTVKVSIDMKGNDPDSGWNEFKVGAPV